MREASQVMRPGTVKALIAAAGAVVLMGGVVVSADLRGDQRLAEQLSSYQRGVVAVAQDFSRAEAPLRAALSLEFEDGLDVPVRVDVFERGNTAADFEALDGRLQTLDVPSRLRPQHDQMRALLADIVAATAVFRDLDRPAEELDAAAVRFVQVADQWPQAARAAVGRIPAASDLGRDQRGETHAGVLYRWSTSCVHALRTSAEAPAITDNESAAVALPWHAETLRDAVDEVLDVVVPAADADRIERDVASPLRQLRGGLQAFNDVADALEAGQFDTVQRGSKDIAALVPLFEQASRGLAGYGASTCADLFSPALASARGAAAA